MNNIDTRYLNKGLTYKVSEGHLKNVKEKFTDEELLKTDKFGNTLMHFAAEGQHGADKTFKMMNYLFTKHVSPIKENDRDERPYDIAHKYTLFKNMQHLHILEKLHNSNSIPSGILAVLRLFSNKF